MPEPIFNHMFGTEPPTVVHIDRFWATAKAHVPLRKNSKLITAEDRALKADSHGGHPSAVRSPQLSGAMPPSLKDEAHGEVPTWAMKLLVQQSTAPPHIPTWPPIKREPAAESKPEPTRISEPLDDASMPPWAKAMFSKLEGTAKTAPTTPKDERGGCLPMPPKLMLTGALTFRRSAAAEASNPQRGVCDTSSHRPQRIYRTAQPFASATELLGSANS